MIDANRKKTLEDIQMRFGIEFNELNLLNEAFIHKSHANESKSRGLKLKHNERLEFFGDAVLKLTISEYLFKKYPKQNEGDLSKMRAYLVSDENLSTICKQLGLHKALLLGESEKNNQGMERTSNTANLLEAIIGAIYLDQGLEKTRSFVENIFSESLENVAKNPGDIKDYKSRLQEYVQNKSWGLPEYKVIKESGPDHEKTFQIQVKAGKGLLRSKTAIGIEKSKKKAEQLAAQEMLKILTGE